MKIIEKTAGLTDRQIFDITVSGNAQKLKDNSGRVITIKDYVIYEDTNSQGQLGTFAAFVTEDGDVIATNSATVMRTFSRMLEAFPMPLTDVEIIEGTSKNGRTYFDLKFA